MPTWYDNFGDLEALETGDLVTEALLVDTLVAAVRHLIDTHDHSGDDGDGGNLSVSGAALFVQTDQYRYYNDTTEKTAFTVTLPADTLGTKDKLRIRAWIEFNLQSSDVVYTIRVKLGSTTLLTITHDMGYHTVARNGAMMLEAMIKANGTTSSQYAIGWLRGDVPGAAGGGGPVEQGTYAEGTGTEDLTTDLTLSITVQADVAGTHDAYVHATEVIGPCLENV